MNKTPVSIENGYRCVFNTGYVLRTRASLLTSEVYGDRATNEGEYRDIRDRRDVEILVQARYIY